MQLIERKKYFDKLIALRDKQIIKVITGVRRYVSPMRFTNISKAV